MPPAIKILTAYFSTRYELSGPSVLVRVMARMHEAAKYYKLARKWLDELDLHDKFYTKPTELAEGKGFGSTEAARGSLSDWIILKNGRIENYQVVTPTAWNIGPRDNRANQRADGESVHWGAHY